MRFYKYHGTGNDFILLDNLTSQQQIIPDQNSIANLCHRRYGIGADGLMILNPHNDFDFEMIYYNSDGALSSMCGNGGRCISQLYFDLGLGTNQCSFLAIDGPHQAVKEGELIKLKMSDVMSTTVNMLGDYILNTGSPHYINFVNDAVVLNTIYQYGRSIRYNEIYSSEGINVNQVFDEKPHSIKMATYERGVENETYSCGTGVVAAAIATAIKHNVSSPIFVDTKGGQLQVQFDRNENSFNNIWLIRPAVRVFEGKL